MAKAPMAASQRICHASANLENMGNLIRLSIQRLLYGIRIPDQEQYVTRQAITSARIGVAGQ
jgi:hypothetical protein